MAYRKNITDKGAYAMKETVTTHIGHRKAQQAADNSPEAWRAEAYRAFVAMAYDRDVFTTGHVRRKFEEESELRPGDNRAWGAITLRAIREKIVKRTKIWEPSGSHHRPDAVWRSMIAKQKK